MNVNKTLNHVVHEWEKGFSWEEFCHLRWCAVIFHPKFDKKVGREIASFLNKQKIRRIDKPLLDSLFFSLSLGFQGNERMRQLIQAEMSSAHQTETDNVVPFPTTLAA